MSSLYIFTQSREEVNIWSVPPGTQSHGMNENYNLINETYLQLVIE